MEHKVCGSWHWQLGFGGVPTALTLSSALPSPVHAGQACVCTLGFNSSLCFEDVKHCPILAGQTPACMAPVLPLALNEDLAWIMLLLDEMWPPWRP